MHGLDPNDKVQKKRWLNRQWLRNANELLKKIDDPAERLLQRLRCWRLGAHAGSLLDIDRDELRVATAAQLVAYAAINAEAGQLSDAYKLLVQAFAHDPDILVTERYIGLIVAMSYFDEDVRSRHSNEIECAMRFQQGTGTLRTLIQDSALRVCVVGNSPCEVGRKLGSEIDGHDVVIRFNDFTTTDGFSEDYGTKTTIWARAASYRDIWRRDTTQFKHVIYPGLSRYWRSNRGSDLVIDCALSQSTAEEVPVRIYNDVVYGVGFHPSSGLVALRTCLSIRGSWSNLNFYGFSLSDQHTAPTHYFPSVHKRAKAVPHNWDYEMKYLHNLVSLGEISNPKS